MEQIIGVLVDLECKQLLPNNEIQIVTWTLSAWSQHTSNNEDIYINGTSQTTEAYSVDTVGSRCSGCF